MTLTLKTKLIVATALALLTIALLVAGVSYGSRVLTEDLRQSHLATTAIRNQTNADMMHDAIRADVFAALYAIRANRERLIETTSEFHLHADQLKSYIASNAALDLPEDAKAPLLALRKPAGRLCLVRRGPDC